MICGPTTKNSIQGGDGSIRMPISGSYCKRVMNRKRTFITLIFLIPLLLITACNRKDDVLLEDLLALEEGDASKVTVDQLKEAVDLLRDEVERTVEAGVQLVNYQKLTAQRFMGQEIYGLAVDFYRRALDLQPTNKLVAYKIGICTSQVAMSKPSEEQKKREFQKALEYHLYALDLDPEYADALYAASVLYIFELDMIGEAEQYLERLLISRPGHIRGMFLLARVYNYFGRVDDAVALYDEIIRESDSEAEIEQAKKNREALNGGGNGF